MKINKIIKDLYIILKQILVEKCKKKLYNANNKNREVKI